MLTTIALATCLFGMQAEGSLIKQVTPTLTGQNGYEEYVAAAEYLRAKNPNLGADQQLTPLARAKLHHAHVEPVLRLITAGNRKPVSRPGPMDLNTPFPEVTKFRTVGRVLAEGAYYEVAMGNANRGVTMLLECQKFSQKLDQTIISLLVGTAMQSLLLAQIQALLPRLPLAELARVEAAAATGFASTDSVQRAFEADYAISYNFIQNAFQDPVAFRRNSQPDDLFASLLLERLEKMTAKDRDVLLVKLREEILKRTTELKRVLAQPESEWSIKEDDDLELSDFFPVISQFIAIEARMRTQWRLARLATRVEAYRWEHRVLPAKLLDCVPAEWLADPLSGKPFVFIAKGPSDYELYSEGGLATGRIEMKYTRPAQSESTPPEPQALSN